MHLVSFQPVKEPLFALDEILDDVGNFVWNANMFTKHTIRQKVVVASVHTASEALTLSLGKRKKRYTLQRAANGEGRRTGKQLK